MTQPPPHAGPHLRRRVDAVARVLAGEPAEAVAAELGVTARAVDAWAKEFCRAGETRLRQLPDNWFERTLVGAEKLVPLATLLSVVIAAVLFVQGQRHNDALAREARVRDAYAALDDKYLDYVKLCLDHPDLDVFDTPLVRPAPPTDRQRRQEAMVLSVLTSLFERAYLMYADPADAFERDQWTAWSAYLRAWAGRPNFRAEWATSRTEFDPAFSAYVDRLVAVPATRPTP